MSDEERARMRQTIALALADPGVLTVSVTDSTVTFATESRGALVLYGNGRKVKQSVEGGGEIELRSHWRGAELVVERKVSGGGKVTEEYRGSPDGKQLTVAVTLSGLKGRSLKFRRVYDRI